MTNRLATILLTSALAGHVPGIGLAEDFVLPPELDLGAIPDAVEDADASPVSNGSVVSLELAFRGFQSNALAGGSSVSTRASAHLFGRVPVADNMGLLFNLRGRATGVEGGGFSFSDNVKFDVQELALSYGASPNLTFEFGRINVRNGVASGYNPTDWFKADSLVTADSFDPGDRREERLGVVALTAATAIGDTLVQFGIRPKISGDPGTVLTDGDIVGLAFDRTNPSTAYFAKVTPDLGGNIAATLDFLVEDGDIGAGFEISGAIGENLVLYSEVFAQKTHSLAGEALASGAGSAAFRAALQADGAKSWHTKVALGGTLSLPENLVGQSDVSVTLEYHFNQTGLSGSQIDALAAASGADVAAAGALRGFTAVQQEPLARHQLFARLAWNDFWGEADAAMLGFFVPHDQSGQMQLSVGMPLGENSEFNIKAATSFGGATSIYGANPTRSSIQVGVTYTF